MWARPGREGSGGAERDLCAEHARLRQYEREGCGECRVRVKAEVLGTLELLLVTVRSRP